MFVQIQKNKYLLTLAAFALWMIFFDTYDVFYINQQRKELKMLESQKEFLITENENLQRQSEELFSSKKSLEKFARERYFFKKSNENVYILEYQDTKVGK
jgi:cell division protein FtsB